MVKCKIKQHIRQDIVAKIDTKNPHVANIGHLSVVLYFWSPKSPGVPLLQVTLLLQSHVIL